MTGPDPDTATITVPLDLPGALAAAGGGTVLSARLRPRVDGVRPTAGTRDDEDGWLLSPGDLAAVAIAVPPGHPPFLVDLEATVTGDGEAEPAIIDLILRVSPPGDGAKRPGGSLAVPLKLPAVADGHPLILRGLPAGASLSAGIDNGDGSWSLKSTEAASLRLYPPPDFSGRMALSVAPAGAPADSAVPLVVEIVGAARPTKASPLKLAARLVPIQGRRPTRLEARGAGADIEAAIPDMTAADAELARLRAEIGDLRGTLEATESSIAETVKAAVAEAEEKLAALKRDAGERRDRLEEIRDAQRGKVEAVITASAEEIARLKSDAQARRDALEALRDARAGAIDAAIGDARATIADLKKTVGALRDEVEGAVSGYREKEAKLRAEADTEAKRLQAIIVQLRDRLESAAA